MQHRETASAASSRYNVHAALNSVVDIVDSDLSKVSIIILGVSVLVNAPFWILGERTLKKEHDRFWILYRIQITIFSQPVRCILRFLLILTRSASGDATTA
jgi:hypothetical protein